MMWAKDAFNLRPPPRFPTPGQTETDPYSVLFYIHSEYSYGEKVMAKILTIRLDEATYETFARAAKAERRPLGNPVETAALQHILECSFVDDIEMAEILSRPALIKRLKAGSRDARNRKGRFISEL
jgi:hypothetical protein